MLNKYFNSISCKFSHTLDIYTPATHRQHDFHLIKYDVKYFDSFLIIYLPFLTLSNSLGSTINISEVKYCNIYYYVTCSINYLGNELLDGHETTRKYRHFYSCFVDHIP